MRWEREILVEDVIVVEGLRRGVKDLVDEGSDEGIRDSVREDNEEWGW